MIRYINILVCRSINYAQVMKRAINGVQSRNALCIYLCLFVVFSAEFALNDASVISNMSRLIFGGITYKLNYVCRFVMS